MLLVLVSINCFLWGFLLKVSQGSSMKAACMFYKWCSFFLMRTVLISSPMWQRYIFHMFPIYVYIMNIYFFYIYILPWVIITSNVQTLGWGDSLRKMQDATQALQWVALFLLSQNWSNALACGSGRKCLNERENWSLSVGKLAMLS